MYCTIFTSVQKTQYCEAKDRAALSFDGNSTGVQLTDGDVDILANSEHASTFTVAELQYQDLGNEIEDCKK